MEGKWKGNNEQERKRGGNWEKKKVEKQQREEKIWEGRGEGTRRNIFRSTFLSKALPT